MTKDKKPKRNYFKEPSKYGTYDGPRGNADQWRDAFGEAWDAATCRTILADQSPWEVLGVKAGADWAEVKAAYRTLIRKNHPDLGGDPETCRKIIAAYTLLEETR